jgi:opacity protein-like surface antigen
MRKNVYFVVASVLLSSAAIARSQDWSQNLYVTGDTGLALQQRADFRQTAVPAVPVTFKPGVRADVGIGYNISDSFAAEFDAGFMWNSVDKINGVPLDSFGESIDLYSVPIFVNAIYTPPVKWDWTPYLGIGAGGTIGIFEGGAGGNDTDIEPSLQAEAGLKCLLTPNASFGIAYKFLATLDQHYYANNFNDHVTFSGVYIHGIFVNLTVNF